MPDNPLVKNLTISPYNSLIGLYCMYIIPTCMASPQEDVMTTISIRDGMRRGLALRCPTCGEGQLFARYLKPTTRCSACGADNTIYPSDDAPPYLTALLIGHLFVPLLLWLDRVYDSPLWLTLSIALPLFA